MEQIIKEFGIQPYLLLAQAVNFLVLLFILNKLLYRPILKVLDDRKQMAAKSQMDAEDIEKKLLQTEEEREKELEKAGKEARKIVEDATKSASQIIEEAHNKAAEDIQEMLKKGQETIKLEREKMQQELRDELSGLVVSAMEKVYPTSLNKKDQKAIVDKTLKQI